MTENPGAYNEARNRIREKQDEEKNIIEEKIVNFEKSKERLRKGKTLDVFELKRRIETGNSLSSLKSDIENALKEGTISFEVYQKTLRTLEKTENNEGIIDEQSDLILSKLPLQNTAIVKFLENQKFGDNTLIDLFGMMYGFFVQGSAIMVILIWNMILDLLKLPRDIYRELQGVHN
ncbi:hypothetical protein KBD33_03925 [Candidatus Gracilibacteria bacterium]|nr:hypothetical protein [Candidatus Gracilibacteria bacterium]